MSETKSWLSREITLIGEDATEKLLKSKVLIFGVGGVGGAALEALVRAGVGHITAVDGDSVCDSNLNRQLVATTRTIGTPKAEAAKERAVSINPDIDFTAVNCFAGADNLVEIIKTAEPDYIIDAIDSVTVKLLLAEYCTENKIPLISSMGTGNKLDPSRFEITDISKTSVCPLARVMRRELSKRGIKHLTVLYSKEEPIHIGQRTPASISYVPTSAGLMIAGYCLRKLGEF